MDDQPQLAPPFPAPFEVPVDTQQPKRKYPPWLPWLVIALAPVVAVCTAVGAYTMAHAVVRSTHAPRISATEAAHTHAAVHLADPPAPTYDLAGYQSMITGPQEQAFVAALNQFRADAKALQVPDPDNNSLQSHRGRYFVVERRAPYVPASGISGLQAQLRDGRDSPTAEPRRKLRAGSHRLNLTALPKVPHPANQAKQPLREGRRRHRRKLNDVFRSDMSDSGASGTPAAMSQLRTWPFDDRYPLALVCLPPSGQRAAYVNHQMISANSFEN
jgi:hypothetical protein